VRIAAFLLLAPLVVSPRRQDGDDLIFRVLRDEMTRSVSRLKLEKSGPPYYVEYTVTETDSFNASAGLSVNFKF
jgi:hypothetical protein